MKLLSLLMVCCLVCGCLTFAAEAEGLVGYWNFDEGKGRVARDRSGHRHHGLIHGARFVREGRKRCLRFDGVDDFVVIMFRVGT